MQYSMTATVKAMKIQEVILRAVSKQILWAEAADIIGVSYRKFGVMGLVAGAEGV